MLIVALYPGAAMTEVTHHHGTYEPHQATREFRHCGGFEVKRTSARIPTLSAIEAQFGKDIEERANSEIASAEVCDTGLACGGERRAFGNHYARRQATRTSATTNF